ncbi:MAG: HAMP domain-containing histidine kinase [Clostridiales bacterium]|nr:HAMP domain-containing histidine kinase [Clostridiales bacterium]
MKAFDRLIACVVIAFLVLAGAVNLYLMTGLDSGSEDAGRQYRVEISRLETAIASGKDIEDLDLSSCEYVTEVTGYEEGEAFYKPSSDYELREIDGRLYRFSYETPGMQVYPVLITCNIIVAASFVVALGVLVYVRKQIIAPMDRLSKVPEDLAKGNLSVDVKAEKSAYLGKFIWGMDRLREKVENDRNRNRELEKEEKMLLLSLSHDIKTPLSAIKLSAKALSSGLYEDDEDRQREVAEGIGAKANEIERYIRDITGAARDDVTIPEVKVTEFYLSELLNRVKTYYDGRYEIMRTQVAISDYEDVLISADIDRAEEVLQNLIENAFKYGTGNRIEVSTAREENCTLVNVKSFGNPVPARELPHIFDSFWRGTNAEGREGSGLGLYICRRLMLKMGGDIYAGITGESMTVTAVFSEA